MLCISIGIAGARRVPWLSAFWPPLAPVSSGHPHLLASDGRSFYRARVAFVRALAQADTTASISNTLAQPASAELDPAVWSDVHEAYGQVEASPMDEPRSRQGAAHGSAGARRDWSADDHGLRPEIIDRVKGSSCSSPTTPDSEWPRLSRCLGNCDATP